MAQNVISDELKFKIFLAWAAYAAELSLATSSIHKSLLDKSKIASDAPAFITKIALLKACLRLLNIKKHKKLMFSFDDQVLGTQI